MLHVTVDAGGYTPIGHYDWIPRFSSETGLSGSISDFRLLDPSGY
jgi:hypothetical protein